MNRINPVHVAILLLVILAFLLMKLSVVKSDLEQAESEYKKTQEVASKIVGLKKAYGEKSHVKKSLDKILSLSQLKSAKLEKKIKKNSIVISSGSMNKKALNTLMGKILNGAFNISTFKIKKLTQNSVSLEMEIKW